MPAVPADPVKASVGPKFFVLSYPRSRTKWLSVALEGLHDGFIGCRSVWDLKERLSYAHGNCDSSNILFYPQLKKAFPDGRFLIVHRDPEEVEDSLILSGLGAEGMPLMMERMEEVLESSLPRIDYEDIDAAGEEIWSICRGEGFDSLRWQELCRNNIQVDVPSYLNEVMLERDALEALCRTLP